MKKYILPTLTVIAVTLGIVIGMTFSQQANAQRIVYQNGQWQLEQTKVDRLLQLMESAYVDPIDVDSITDEVMTELVQKLDPHSAYIPKEDLEMVNSELAGSFSGIGVQFTIQQDTVRIVAVISGGPSEGVGVLAGDKLVSVDDSAFVGKKMNNEKVMKTLRGPKGTKVKLGILRAGSPETLYFTITRGDIPVTSVDAKFIIEQKGKKLGFVRVNKFGETTYKEFITALAELKAKGATSYIIDLRENSGGYMDQAIRMANEFLRRGERIVYSEGRAYPRYEAKADGSGRFKDVPLVVLIDDFSASASEIFSGAMQDNDRATIIGRRSFGKGLVQEPFFFNDNSGVRLTVARYYTPSGRCIQKPYSSERDYAYDIYNRYADGEVFSADSVKLDTSDVHYTRKGRKVYGGGGIMPDIFVPMDTTRATAFYLACNRKATQMRYASYVFDKYASRLREIDSYPAMDRFLSGLNLKVEFPAYAKRQDGITCTEAEWDQSASYLVPQLQALIARYSKLGENAFYKYYLPVDNTVTVALQTD